MQYIKHVPRIDRYWLLAFALSTILAVDLCCIFIPYTYFAYSAFAIWNDDFCALNLNAYAKCVSARDLFKGEEREIEKETNLWNVHVRYRYLK